MCALLWTSLVLCLSQYITQYPHLLVSVIDIFAHFNMSVSPYPCMKYGERGIRRLRGQPDHCLKHENLTSDLQCHMENQLLT